MFVLFGAIVVLPLIALSLKVLKPLLSVSKTASICVSGSLRIFFFASKLLSLLQYLFYAGHLPSR